jgi:DNA-binding PadR family transcriptional regulator
LRVRGEVLKGHLDLILLAALRARPAYGYALIRDLRERTAGSLDLTEGTIYPVLHRLEEAGYLESSLLTVQSRRRRLYTITPSGHAELDRLLQEWSQFARGVENLLGSGAV